MKVQRATDASDIAWLQSTFNIEGSGLGTSYEIEATATSGTHLKLESGRTRMITLKLGLSKLESLSSPKNSHCQQWQGVLSRYTFETVQKKRVFPENSSADETSFIKVISCLKQIFHEVCLFLHNNREIPPSIQSI